MTYKEAAYFAMAEAAGAQKQYGRYLSKHEAADVLAEECEELIEALRRKSDDEILLEATQVAAVALRIMCSEFTR